MGKGSPKIEVTQYYMSQHFGICSAELDLILAITIKEKTAWEGRQAAGGAITISQPELYGGLKKEGGVQGTAYYLPGDSSQVLPDNLAVKLGRANGADCPGFRGLSSLFFYGSSPDGFYWTANTPYLPGVWVTVQRIFKESSGDPQWYQGKAGIPRPGTGENVSTPYDSTMLDTDAGGQNIFFSPDFRTLYCSGYYGISLVDNVALEIEHENYGSFAGLDDRHVAWENGGYLGLTGGPDALYSYTPDGTGTALGFSGLRYLNSVQDINGVWHWAARATSNTYFDGTNLGNLSWGNLHLFSDSEGVTWLVGTRFAGAGTRFLAVNGAPSEFPADFTIPEASLAGDLNGVGIDYQGDFVFTAGGTLYKIDSDLNIVDSLALAAQPNWDSIDPDAQTIWCGRKEISLFDFSTVQEILPSDWGLSLGASTVFTYDPRQDALVYFGSSGPRWLFFPEPGVYDMNPAHIIRESLTDANWGMGTPSTAIDDDAFIAAADTLYDEGFGLSMIWTRQSTIQDFIQEILDHIQGVIYVDPATGLLTLSLIRGDYDADTLDVIDPDNADLTSFSRKLWGDIVNEIIVTWTNPDNEQEETITVQDDSSIATQGGAIISDSRNYYGVRYSALAQQLAMRDLRSAGQPLAAVEAEVDRSQWALRPASVIKVTWPEYGLSEIVMRVQSVDYGKPGEPTIKLSLVEDVYGLDIGSYDDPPSSSWVDPSAEPEPFDQVEIFTLPYFFALGTTVAAFVDNPEYPEVISGVLATTENDDAFAYELWDQVVLPNGSTEWQSLTTNNIIGHAELLAALDAEATTADVSFDNFVGKTSPTVAGFVIIGADGEAGNEIAMIDSSAGGDYDLVRGVLDTVPRAWPAGTPVWFVDGETLFEDTLIRAAGEAVDYKLLMRTSQGLLDLGDAPLESYTLTERPWLPNRPANVTAYGEAWSSEVAPIDARLRPDPWVTVTWAIRNRLDEDALVLAWTDASGTAEPGQTTTIEVRDADGVLLTTHDGLSGTSFDVPDASFSGELLARLRVYSERSDDDGDFVSLQYFEHWVQIDGDTLLLSGDATDGDDRLLLSGDETGRVRISGA